jgi:hypothetical protein
MTEVHLLDDATAAAIRERAWTQPMRKQHREVPLYTARCACQSGLTHWCEVGRHARCHRGTPLRSYATVICTPGGMAVACFAEYFGHKTDVSATGPRFERAALVWLADRVCRWVCPCTCHTAPPPQQLDLFATAGAA